MSRPRVGHGWSMTRRGSRRIGIFQRDSGEWVTTGEATGWPRCRRCRRPIEASPFESGLCPICYFYKTIPVDEFWRLHNEGYYLAPYNIGERCSLIHPPERLPRKSVSVR